MTGTTDRLEAGARIGDYVVERGLPARPGLVGGAARHALLPRRARIACLHPALAADPTLGVQLVREACILESLRHPGAPRVFECGLTADGRPWIATELIEGPTLADALATSGPLALPVVLALLADVAEILHHAHARGIAHRDLRPAAIAHRAEGPCVVDWADAWSRDAEPAPRVRPPARAYQAPEVFAGAPADSRADVFALGVVAYEALAGAPSLAPAVRRFPGAPARLTALLDRMRARDPLARPTSAEVRAEALALIDHVDVPVQAIADEDGHDVQVVDVDVAIGMGLGHDADPDAEAALERALDADTQLELQIEPALAARERLRWTPPAAYQGLGSPRGAAAPSAASAASAAASGASGAGPYISRTLTEPMPPHEQLEQLAAVVLSRTKTEPMPDDPEPGRGGSGALKLALPSRLLEPRGKA